MNIENKITTQSSRINYPLAWILRGIVLSICMVIQPVFAQSIVTDGTTNSQINGDCSGSCQITGTDIDIGNNNLFHSFQRFNVDTNATVTFIDPGVSNIITRVTGGNLSLIDGTLGVQGNANLFLINPNGIIFGSNASLDISGSFLATTADSLVFKNGQQFSAIDASSSPLLSVNVPLGLQLGGNPRPIEVQGTGNNLFLNLEDFTINRTLRPTGLEVGNGNTLALIGGDILLDGGNLTAETGKIELGSVEQGFVGINPLNSGWSFDYSNVLFFNDIQLSNASSLDVAGDDAGVIELRGRNISLSDGSSLLANVLVQGGGEINLRAEETISLVGSSFVLDPLVPFPLFMPSSITVEIEPGALGDGSSKLNISAQNLEIVDGAQIGLSMAGLGNGGFLNVSAKNNITLDGGTPFGPSSIFVATLPFFGSDTIEIPALGRAGELTIDTNSLQVLNGAQIIASTFGLGDAGNLKINAKDIEVVGFNPGGSSKIVSTSEVPPGGKGGNVTIDTQRLLVADGGQISTGTVSFTSPAGNLVINASESVTLEGEAELGRSGLFANAFSLKNPETGAIAFSEGDGGSITVNTGQLIVRDGATINVSNNASNPDAPDVAPGLGNAGNLNVNAESILLDNQSILTAETASGDQGNISLKAQNIQLLNESIISTNATEEASGGNIDIVTGSITIRDNSKITANASGEGSSGSISIVASDPATILLDQGQITSNGGEGNIFLSSPQIFLRNGSSISANGTGTSPGGNVNISTQYLFAVPNENSDITANAQNSLGGRVIISARSIVGIEFRERQTSLSDITVTSELGPAFSGVVEIRNENIDPQATLVELPNQVVDGSTQIAKGCSTERGNVFTVTGRGGLPENPNYSLQGRNLWQDLRPIENTNTAVTSTQKQPQSKYETIVAPIVEAQELIVDGQGKIKLVAQVPESQSANTWHQSSCNTAR